MKKAMIIAGIAAIGLWAASALASDDKTIPGFSCVKSVAAGTAAYNEYGWFLNSAASGSDMGVLCPLVRDDPDGTDRAVNWITVTVVDRSSAGAIDCWVVSASRDSMTAYWGSGDASVGNSSVPQDLTPSMDLGSYEFGSFFLDCDIPAAVSAQSAIVSYYYGEDSES